MLVEHKLLKPETHSLCDCFFSLFEQSFLNDNMAHNKFLVIGDFVSWNMKNGWILVWVYHQYDNLEIWWFRILNTLLELFYYSIQFLYYQTV